MSFCTGCGAPLLLQDDRPPPPLDAPLDLDRRGRGEPGGDPAATMHGVLPPRLPGPAPHAEELAALERSHWDLGGPAAPRAEPDPGAPPPLPSAAATPLPPARTVPVPARVPARAPFLAAAAHAVAAERGRAGRAEHALPDAEVDALEVHVARAESWRRALAWALDGAPFVAAGVALARRFVREAGAGLPAASEGIDGFLDLLARERVIALSVAGAVALALAVYATLAHALGGATLGKRLVGIRVVGPDGAPPSPARSAIRSALALLSAGLLGLGFLLALFTRTGRALHDLLARTWVVKAP
ncbi:MAG TPA: RDD family protein [Anaeromyxobacter sp.]